MKATTSWMTQFKREQKEEQADEKVVENVDRMTTKRSHKISKDDSKCTICHFIYVLHN
jgi:hypothetical protein